MDADRLSMFVGNPDAYSVQQDDGTYSPVRKPLTKTVLSQHLAGTKTIGTYVLKDTQARFICFDVDSGDAALEEANRVVAACEEMGVAQYAVGVEFSGRKGYHVWVPVGEWREAAELRRFGRGVLALADVEGEVYPKQDRASDLGNLIKLPGGKHKVSGMASTWLTEVPFTMPTGRWETAVVPNLPPELSGRRFNTGVKERFPCMDAILSEGVKAGSRNNQLFHLATMLRRAGLTSEYVRQVFESVNEKGDPLDPFELDQLLGSAEVSGPVCDQLPEDRRCGDLCIRAMTSGLYTRPGQLRHAAVGENVVVTLAGRSENIVTLEHDDLENAKGVLGHGG